MFERKSGIQLHQSMEAPRPQKAGLWKMGCKKSLGQKPIAEP